MATPNLKAADHDPQGYSSDSSSNSNNGAKTAKVNVLELFRGRRSDTAAFDMTEDARFYKPIDSYEGIHRWDPDFEWEEWEERKIVRKVSALYALNLSIAAKEWKDRSSYLQFRMSDFLCAQPRQRQHCAGGL